MQFARNNASRTASCDALSRPLCPFSSMAMGRVCPACPIARCTPVRTRLTLAYVQRGWNAFLYQEVAGGDFEAAASEAERYARKAIEIDPLDAEANILLAAGRVSMWARVRGPGGDDGPALWERQAVSFTPLATIHVAVALARPASAARPADDH
jgi:hypothetical protein